MRLLASITIALLAAAGGSVAASATAPTATPAAAPTQEPTTGNAGEMLSVTSPVEGEKLISRLPRFFGTAPLTATVVFSVAGEERARDVVDPNGHFSVVVPFTLREEAQQDVRIAAFLNDAEVASVERSVVLPPSFAVVTPGQNTTTSSRDVVVSGTAVPESSISLTVPSGQAGGATTVPVPASGEWSATLTFADAADTAQSVTVRQFVAGEQRGEFTLRFALPPATGISPVPDDGQIAPPATTSPTLPETGSETAGTLLLLSLASMVVGGIVIARRRLVRRR